MNTEKINKKHSKLPRYCFSERFLDFDEWCDTFANEIDIELAENGADKEMDFNPEVEYQKRYEMYLNAR